MSLFLFAFSRSEEVNLNAEKISWILSDIQELSTSTLIRPSYKWNYGDHGLSVQNAIMVIQNKFQFWIQDWN